MTDSPHSASGPLDHSGLAARRVAVAVVLAVITAAVAVGAGASWFVAALGAEDAAAAAFVISVWASIAGADVASTARTARAEDASRAAAEAVLLGAGVASLLAVVFTLAPAGNAGAPGRGLLTALAIASIALACFSVHTVFLLRYARIYCTPPGGKIDFGAEPPDYRDFAYLALTIGSTFRVSDNDVTAKRVRRIALHHALLSYLFGTVIVALRGCTPGCAQTCRDVQLDPAGPRGAHGLRALGDRGRGAVGAQEDAARARGGAVDGGDVLGGHHAAAFNGRRPRPRARRPRAGA